MSAPVRSESYQDKKETEEHIEGNVPLGEMHFANMNPEER